MKDEEEKCALTVLPELCDGPEYDDDGNEVKKGGFFSEEFNISFSRGLLGDAEVTCVDKDGTICVTAGTIFTLTNCQDHSAESAPVKHVLEHGIRVRDLTVFDADNPKGPGLSVMTRDGSESFFDGHGEIVMENFDADFLSHDGEAALLQKGNSLQKKVSTVGFHLDKVRKTVNEALGLNEQLPRDQYEEIPVTDVFIFDPDVTILRYIESVLIAERPKISAIAFDRERPGFPVDADSEFKNNKMFK